MSTCIAHLFCALKHMTFEVLILFSIALLCPTPAVESINTLEMLDVSTNDDC